MWSRPPRFQPRFTIAVAAADQEHVVADATLNPFDQAGDRHWTDVDVDLTPWAGTSVELVLRVTSPSGLPAFADRPGFGEPRVVP